MSVLVLMATHNGMAYLSEQVRTIREQTGLVTRILAYDDQSTDHTAQWLDAQGIERLPTRPERLGPAGSFVHLLLHANLSGAQAIALSDQDDLWLPEKLSVQLESLLANPRTGGVSSNVLALWPSGRLSYLDKIVRPTTHDHLLESAGPGCTYLLSLGFVEALRRAWTQLGQGRLETLVRGRPFHDWLIYASARALHWEWKMLEQPLVHYRQHNQNVFGANLGFAGRLARLRELANGDFQARQTELVAYINEIEPTEITQEWIRISAAKGLRARYRRAIWLFTGRRRKTDGALLALAALVGLWS